MKNFKNTKTYQKWRAKNSPPEVEIENEIQFARPVILREKNGHFVKGVKVPVPARRSGVPSKRTQEQVDRAERLLRYIEADFLEKDIALLTPAQRCNLWKDVLVYRQPQLSKSLVLNQNNSPVTEIKQVFIIAGAEFTFTQKQ
jgi:hypothetical protein